MNIRTFSVNPDVEEDQLTAYLLEPSPEMRNTPRPAVLVLPGGAYLFTSDREAEPVALEFAAEGCQTFVLRYSVGQMEPGHPAFPDCLYEAVSAVALIRAHAEEWDIDPGNINVCGFSAGGHLALQCATSWRRAAGELELDPELARVNGSITGYPLSDYRVQLSDECRNIMDEQSRQLMDVATVAMFGSAEPTEEELDELSPAQLVGLDTPPAFLWATSADSLVPALHALDYARALATAGIPYELHIFEKGKHGLSLATPATRDKQGGAVDAEAAAWIGLARAWIRRDHARGPVERGNVGGNL